MKLVPFVLLLLCFSTDYTSAEDVMSNDELNLTLSVFSACGDIQLVWTLENISEGTLKVLKRWWNPASDKTNNINFFTLYRGDTVWSEYRFAPPFGDISQYDFMVLYPHQTVSDITPQLHPYYSDEIRVGMPLGENYAYAIYSMENITGFGNVWNGTIKSNTVCFIVCEVYETRNTNWRVVKTLADYRNLENLIK